MSAPLTWLTSLDLGGCREVIDEGVKMLAPLTEDDAGRTWFMSLTHNSLGGQFLMAVPKSALHTPAGNLPDGGPLPPAGNSAGGFACDPLQLWSCFG
jgi:hypothetical protein